ncbi:uncharacterized protein MRET_1277 [Malassezia restricta]|uniref:uncharacterized protein n=1 Tax=Malassezia restricta TaxID=76775 RepID=UPI000DD14626|nr:uncharacterized protein MRET_1277 [Malassezia restricta]AXA48988.1 uncharacterized protein MRET_1277 [Malassezia restricta]
MHDMLSTIFQPCELQVNLIQNVIFLRPPQRAELDAEHRTHELPPLSNDELVRGIIHLYAPSSRHIDGLRVHLRATMSLAHLDTAQNQSPSSWETSTFMDRILEICVPPRLSKLNAPRSSSSSVPRPRSPSIVPGGGGRHGDSHDIFRNMVRGVSKNRASRSGSQTPALLRIPHGMPTTHHEDPRCSNHSLSRTPYEHSGTSTPQYGFGGGAMTDEDLQHVTEQLEAQNVHDDEFERRGRAVSRREPLAHNEEKRGRSKSKHLEVISQGGDEDGMELSKGVHMFEFAFIVPADSPPYDRSPFGKVRYMVKVTALGAGRARSNVEEWRDFFPMVNPAPDGGVTPLTVLFNDVHPTMGLLSVACTSNNISVGGLFNIDIHSPSPPPDLIVYMARVSLHTTIEVTTRRRGRQVSPVQKRRLFEKGIVAHEKSNLDDIDHMPGYIRYAGDDSAWTVQGVARIPDDNAIRPSTMSGTRSPLRFHHTLVVEVVHSRSNPSVPDALTPEGRRKIKVFTLRQGVIIPSCCCALDAVTLPAYSPSSNSAPNVPQLKHLTGSTWEQIVMANQDRGESHNMCVCGMSLADLSAAEQAMLPPPDPTDLMISEATPGRKPGELQSSDDLHAGLSDHSYYEPMQRPTASRAASSFTDLPPAYTK